MSMLFHNLNRLLTYERQCLKFIRSSEDRGIIIAIGCAVEEGTPIGFKQLALLNIASPSTITRKLNRLTAAKVIRRAIKREDGRMVSYVLTKRTVECFERYWELLHSLSWGTDAPNGGRK